MTYDPEALARCLEALLKILVLEPISQSLPGAVVRYLNLGYFYLFSYSFSIKEAKMLENGAG